MTCPTTDRCRRPQFPNTERKEAERVQATYDAAEDTGDDGPFFTEADMIRLYPPDVVAAAGRATACDPGSGPTRIDD
jgi:hypothetical protein